MSTMDSKISTSTTTMDNKIPASTTRIDNKISASTLKMQEKDVEAAPTSVHPSSRGRAPPDGGWGWVIVFAGGFALSIAMGFNKSVALVYQALLEKFQQSAAATAWVTSLTGMIRMMSSPFVSSLCNRFTHRKVAVAAGIITSASYILSAFPPNLPYLYITLGLMQGIGVNMFIVPSLSITAIYFDRNKGKAMSMITSSFGFGALYMAPLLRLLFSEFGYSGTLLILGGLVLHFSAAGLLFRPLSIAPKWSDEDKPVGAIASSESIFHSGKIVSSRTDISKGGRGKDAQEPLLDSESLTEEEGTQENKRPVVAALMPPKPIGPLPYVKSQEVLAVNATSKKTSACRKVGNAIKSGAASVGRELGLEMLADSQFLLLGFTMSSIAWTMTNSWTLAAGLAKEKNFTSSQVTLLLVIVAAAELPCRLLSGVLFDIRPFQRLRPVMFAFISFGVGIGNASLPFVPGVVPTFIVWALSMGFLGACNSQYPTVMSDLVPRSKVTSALGLIRLMQGVGALLGPFIGGLMRDHTGTYAYGFYAGGLQLVVFSILLAIRSYFILVAKNKSEPKEIEDEKA